VVQLAHGGVDEVVLVEDVAAAVVAVLEAVLSGSLIDPESKVRIDAGDGCWRASL
jgi:hypothetical protein